MCRHSFYKASLPLLIAIVLMVGALPGKLTGQIGFKAGMSFSSFSYVREGPVPNLSFEIDLRPHLGYEIYWLQLGEQKPLYAPYLGIYWSTTIIKRLKLLAELAFTQKGVNFSQSDYEKIKFKVQISYLEIPVLLSYDYIAKEKFIADIHAGIYGSLMLGAKKKVETQQTGMLVSDLANARNIVSGFAIGLNFKYKIVDHFLLLNLRTFIDINDALLVPEEQVHIYHTIQKVRNTGFYLTLGYEI